MAGGLPGTARERLRAFWERAIDNSVPFGFRASRQAAAIRALLGGRPGVCVPTLPGFRAIHWAAPNDDHLHSTVPLRRALAALIDLDRLNDGATRLIATALDQKTGEDVAFDSAETRLTLDHLMASCALPLTFPPVETGGRVLVDPGYSANLPVAAIFRDMPQRDALCWALDLWPGPGERPPSPDTVLRRSQDLLFSAQRRHALERLSEVASSTLEEAGLGRRRSLPGL